MSTFAKTKVLDQSLSRAQKFGLRTQFSLSSV